MTFFDDPWKQNTSNNLINYNKESKKMFHESILYNQEDAATTDTIFLSEMV